MARGRSVTGLLEELSSEQRPGTELIEAARKLDRHYVPTRYPNGFPSGAPVDYFTREDAEDAIAKASEILRWCRDRAR